jgi:diguanylate cyclase (GGDEF)-like protein
MTEHYADFFCSRDIVLSLVKAGVPANSKWGALILYMRSITEYDYLSAEQKQQMQDLVMQIIRERDYSETRFKEFVRLQEQILYKPWNTKLEEAFRETVGLIEHIRSQNIQRAKEVKDLRETTINTVREQNALEDIVTEIRAAFGKVIWQLEEDTRDLVEKSYTDSLTKLNNRRAFDRYFQATLAEHVVTGKPMSLMFLDIDHFKAFNDSYGHRIGDQALVTVAGKLMGFAHKYSTVPNRSFFPARFGGEEFVVVLPGVGLDEAREDAESLRAIIEEYNFIIRDHNGQVLQKGIKITVSVGVSTLRPEWKTGQGERLLDEADRAMYRAKNKGRNQVCTMGEC